MTLDSTNWQYSDAIDIVRGTLLSIRLILCRRRLNQNGRQPDCPLVSQLLKRSPKLKSGYLAETVITDVNREISRTTWRITLEQRFGNATELVISSLHKSLLTVFSSPDYRRVSQFLLWPIQIFSAIPPGLFTSPQSVSFVKTSFSHFVTCPKICKVLRPKFLDIELTPYFKASMPLTFTFSD